MHPTIVEYQLVYNNDSNGIFFDQISLKNIKTSGLKNMEVIYNGILYSTKDDKSILEFLFALTSNIYEDEDDIIEYNPLGMVDVQETIRRSKAHHTSMSVGDVVGLKRQYMDWKYYLCISLGFEDITKYISSKPDTTASAV